MRIPDPLWEPMPARVAGTAQLNRVRGFTMSVDWSVRLIQFLDEAEILH